VKKAIVIICAVAILGELGIYTQKHSSSSAIGNSSNSSAAFTPSLAATNSTSNTSASPAPNYKDGTYTGGAENTPYGEVQVAVTINSGKIIGVNFLQMPSDRGHSREVTSYSEPLLKHDTLQKQNATIDFISGATSTCYGYQQSLQAALDKAAGVSFAPSTRS
jgi:uncharacterized protein with FMN-binding domain